MRYVLDCDDDGHWYVLPLSEHEDFLKYIEDAMIGGETLEQQEQFEKYRLTGGPTSFTFTNPEV